MRRWPLLMVLTFPWAGCGGGERPLSSEAPLAPEDTNVPGDSLSPGPPDTTGSPPPSDSVAPPPLPPDTTTPPGELPDTTSPPPPDTTGPVTPARPHEGIPFGPWHLPMTEYGSFSGAVRGLHRDHPVEDLEHARRTGTRVLLAMAGSESAYQDENGHFSLAKWKQRVDRFKHVDMSSYVADGTIIGHLIMDEPEDPTNWNGKLVTQAEIEEMARYSKELWPSMAAIIRAWPRYLKGYSFKHLDAEWAQYHIRFGDINAFIQSNVSDAKASNLALIMSVNLLAGGGEDEGLFGYHHQRYALNARQLRTWANKIMDEPYICAMLDWQYEERYFAREDVKSVFKELAERARTRPKKLCRPG